MTKLSKYTVFHLAVLFTAYLSTLFLFVLNSQAIETPKLATPQFNVKAPIFDFGSVKQGAKITHEFVLENAGNLPLEIQKISPACGCTAAELSNKTIAPGQSEPLKVTFDTDGFHGPKDKTVRIYSNDPKEPMKVLRIKGIIMRDITVIPSRIYFGEVRFAGKNEKILKVILDNPSSVLVKKVTSDSEFINVSHEKLKNNTQHSGNIIVKIKQNAPIGQLRSRISIKTNSKENPVIVVPVFAKIVGDLVLQPSDITFGYVDSSNNDTISKSIKLINSGEENIKVLSIEGTGEKIKAFVRETLPGREYEIIVSLQPAVVGAIKEELIIKTNHSDTKQKDVTLPVFGLVAKKGE